MLGAPGEEVDVGFIWADEDEIGWSGDDDVPSIRCGEGWRASPADLETIGAEIDLHELAVEDVLEADQRPKIERYGETTLLVLKAITYDDGREELSFDDVFVAFGADFAVAFRSDAEPGLRLTAANGQVPVVGPVPGVLVHRVVDRLVDAYEPVIDAIDTDVRQIEATVFGPSDEHPTERIYLLKRQLVALLRNIRPLVQPIQVLATGALPGLSDELRDYFRDVHDHLQRVLLRAENSAELLGEILDANLTQVSLQQNEDMRRMSAWAAIFLVPTLLAGVWGMNFDTMPETGWRYGYPAALTAMVGISALLYWRFKRIEWL